MSIFATLGSGKYEYRITVLHSAPPNIAEVLIYSGAEPDSLDEKGRTPLSWMLEFPQELVMMKGKPDDWDCTHRYWMCRLFVRAGAILPYAMKKVWGRALVEFEREGFDVEFSAVKLRARAN
ncbi:hypothetical protein B0T25DRAFT_179942 [Lasiosphaeria hispida]|uniref:Uncharacterized protein n=1 Tax=Lasiosphaeria hispida TaxID=260671 RepID=A0AAJ0HGJ5_9PEZI|nr:hypothetical protein B0T25DRAFT_179942 [Lasiosphaeria hispida]